MNNHFDEMKQRKNAYKWDGLKYDDTLSLGIADMDYTLSDDIMLPFMEQIKKANFGYEYEGDSYYEALIMWYRRNHSVEIDRSWIITSPGVISGIKTVINAFSKERDSVIVLSPMYHSYISAIRNNNRKVIDCPMTYKGCDYVIDYKKFETLIDREKVKIFIFCNPNNPTGKVFCEEEIKMLLEVCKKYQVLVVADEVYEDFIYDDVLYHSCINFLKQYDHIIVAKSLCKTFNTAGIQVANFIIYNEKNREKFNKEKKKRTYISNNSMGILMTECLFKYGDKWHKECWDYIKENMKIFKQFINDNYPEVVITQAQALYTLWIDFSKICQKEIEIKKLFEEQMHLKVLEGGQFGEEGQYTNFVRINFACPRFIILEMIRRMDCELKKIKEKMRQEYS